jgi:hypothetical protein
MTHPLVREHRIAASLLDRLLPVDSRSTEAVAR